MKKVKDLYVQLILLFASISFIVIGVYRNEVQIILTKAINICLECIGLG